LGLAGLSVSVRQKTRWIGSIEEVLGSSFVTLWLWM
jgi:hypothetical protein